jgi:hypothetical protein
MSTVTPNCVGHYATRLQRSFSSSEKLVDVAVNEETGKKWFKLIGICFFVHKS